MHDVIDIPNAPLPQLPMPDAAPDAAPPGDLAVLVETIRQKAIAEFVEKVQPLIEQAAAEWEERGERLGGIKGNERARLQAHVNHGRASGLRMAGGVMVEVMKGRESALGP